MAVDKTEIKAKKILLCQLSGFGDCLYATAIARQIKTDYPDCKLTWAVSSLCRTILDGNPYVDDIWVIEANNKAEIYTAWFELEKQAKAKKKSGEFDEIFLTQISPGNLQNFDGTVRASIFRAYPHQITVPITPVIRLNENEIKNVENFVENYKLADFNKVILFECNVKSGQSFVTTDFAIEFSKKLLKKVTDVKVILSSNEKLNLDDDKIVDGSILSFRENAELSKYCTLLIGGSSGISWLCTSDWAKHLPMIQLLKEDNSVFASFVHDHKYFGLPAEEIIEITRNDSDYLVECVNDIWNEGFDYARNKYHYNIPLKFNYFWDMQYIHNISKLKFIKLFKAMIVVIKRYGIKSNLFSYPFIKFIDKLKRLFI